MVPVIECTNITKDFGSGHTRQAVLAGVSLRFGAGESCVLLGPSGSGKTTLLSILGCLLSPTDGQLRLRGELVPFRSKGRLAWLRRRHIGFVFQQAQLLPFLTIEENLTAVGQNAGLDRRTLRNRVNELLDVLGLQDLRRKSPLQASGGERQRVAVARALVHWPPIILADEPTAALDWANGQNVVRLLAEQTQRMQSLLIAVTHDTRLVPMFQRTLRIDSGRIVES
ncbi:MAG: ABC transporter ATP-binding protein [Planctomycetota bacterium]|nr:ABC transporter ATP-binding protein [Planctomycetota bacterium]